MRRRESCETGPAAGAGKATALERDGAWQHIAAGALRPGVAGPVGLELERHLVDLTQPARRPAWQRIARALAGVKPPGGSTLSLEPGGQIELSTQPAGDVETAIMVLPCDCAVADGALAAAGLPAVSIGADPARPPSRIHPGDRYAAMAEYFTAAGYAGDGAVMMTATASLQVPPASPKDVPVGW